MWLISYIFIFLSFAGTLLFLRFVGRVVRRFIPQSKTVGWNNLKISIVYIAPTVSLGILLLIFRNWFGVILISTTAVWLSLFWDAIHLFCALNFVRKLRRLRHTPDSFFYQVKLVPYNDWAKSNFKNISPFRYWLRGFSFPSSLQMFSFLLKGNNEVRIFYGDFDRFLRRNIRLIDSIEDAENKLPLTAGEVIATPHLEAINGEPKQNKFYFVNRVTNTALPDELWETSCRLCQTTPPIIAATWKLYHFQEDVRLRLVTLFNAADLMQRLIGAMILRMLEETGELDALLANSDFPRDKSKKPIYPPNTNADWNWVLSWTLKNSKSEELEIFRQILLEPNPNFAANLEKLAPFWQILQITPRHPTNEQNTLANFYILNQLRNKTIGHGSIGWKLQLRPAVYLSALHYFFLATMENISKLDLGVLAYRQSGEILETASTFRGLWATEIIKDDYQAAIENPFSGKFLPLSPYLRFYNGRLLIVDRFSKEHAIYIDYNPENITEPSFIKLEISSIKNLTNAFR